MHEEVRTRTNEQEPCNIQSTHIHTNERERVEAFLKESRISFTFQRNSHEFYLFSLSLSISSFWLLLSISVYIVFICTDDLCTSFHAGFNMEAKMLVPRPNFVHVTVIGGFNVETIISKTKLLLVYMIGIMKRYVDNMRVLRLFKPSMVQFVFISDLQG